MSVCPIGVDLRKIRGYDLPLQSRIQCLSVNYYWRDAMIQIRPASELVVETGWLKTQHTFSFNDYGIRSGWDSVRCGSSTRIGLRPTPVFRRIPIATMEIITYVLEGKLEHKDSLGTGSVILPGDGPAHDRWQRHSPQ